MHTFFMLTTLAYGAEGLHFSAFVESVMLIWIIVPYN